MQALTSDDSKYGNRYNRSRIVELYESGWSVSRIAKAAGSHRTTIYNHLAAAGVKMRDDRLTNPGVAPKTHCAKNHEYTEKNTRVDKKGHKHCRTCDNERARRRYREKIIEQFIAEQTGNR